MWDKSASVLTTADATFNARPEKFLLAMAFPAPDLQQQFVAELSPWSISLTSNGHYLMRIGIIRGKTIGFQPEIILDKSAIQLEIDPDKLTQGNPKVPAFLFFPNEISSDYVVNIKLTLAEGSQSSTAVHLQLESAIGNAFRCNWRLMSRVLLDAGLGEPTPAAPHRLRMGAGGGPGWVRFEGGWVRAGQFKPAEAAAPPPDPSVDLMGWDLAFGVPIEQVNAYLATNASKFTASFSEINGTFAGSIGTWRVLRGGTGRLLKMAITIITGESNSTLGHIDLAGVELEFQIDLAFQPAPESGNKSHLTFNLTGSGDSSHITPIRVTKKGALADKVTNSLVSRYLPQCLQAHAANLRYILACAALGRDPGSWLDAKHWDYVYFQPDGSTQAFLTVLGSASTTAFPSEAKVDPVLFSQATGAQNEVFLAVGKDQFMNHVIIPGLALAYPIAKPGTFVFDAATQTIKSTSGFSVGGKATVATLSLEIDNSTATVNTTGTASVGINSTINWQTTSKNAITFDSVTQILIFASDPNPTVVSQLDGKWYDYIAAIIVPGMLILDGLDIGHYDALIASLTSKPLDAGGPAGAVNWSGSAGLQIQDCHIAKSFYLKGISKASSQ